MRALGTIAVLALLLAASAAVTHPSGTGAADIFVADPSTLGASVAGLDPNTPQGPPWITLEEAQWRLQKAQSRPINVPPPPCSTTTSIAVLVTKSDQAFETIPIDSPEGGQVQIELMNNAEACALKGMPVDVSGDHLELTLFHFGDDRPVASVPLPALADCAGCELSSGGNIRLLPGDGIEVTVTVYHVIQAYYRVRLSGTVRIRESGFRRTFTPAPGSWPGIVLFAADVRRALPGTHHATTVHFRGTDIPWDWVDSPVTSGTGSNPWMLVELRAHTPWCNAERGWFIAVAHAEFVAEGQAFRTIVPQLTMTTSPARDEYRWQLMPLPADTRGVDGILQLDVHACGMGQPVIAHDVLRVSLPAPPAYSSPGSVKPAQVPGAWEVLAANGPVQCANCDGFPLMIELGPAERVQLGAVAPITISLSSRIPSAIMLKKPVIIRMRIRSAQDIGCCPVIWEGILPPLPRSIPPGSVELTFPWDQRDSSGQFVPLGGYFPEIEFPIEFTYTVGGTLGEEQLRDVAIHGGTGIEVRSIKQFYNPQGICVDGAGRIYVADSRNNRIVRMNDMAGAGFTTLGGIQGSGVNQFYGPTGIFVDQAGRIYVADTLNDRIVRMNDMTGAGWTALGTPGDRVRQIKRPTNIFVDSDNQIYVPQNNRVVRMDDMTGAGWTTLERKGEDAWPPFGPSGVFVDRARRIYVVDNSELVRVDDMTGTGWISLGGRQGGGVKEFLSINGVFVDGAGRIYVVDSGNNRIVRMEDMSGAGWTAFGSQGRGVNQFYGASGIFVDPTGHIYVADFNNDRIVRFNDMTGAGWITFGAEAK